ncbi:Crp/Fnr family transcriptional regulator [Cupriavidus metallidurans]|nr:Crp/Fnr family transcriptional regulator [Cupriavidus metallidurans]
MAVAMSTEIPECRAHIPPVLRPHADAVPVTPGPDTSLLIGAVLRQAAWAAACQPSTVQAFARGGVVRHMKRHAIVVRRGDPVRRLGIVLSGILQAGVHACNGKRMTSAYMASGQLFNLVPFLDGGMASKDFVAHTDLTVCWLNKSLVETAMSTDAELQRAFIQVLCARSRQCLSDRAGLLLLTLRQRCAEVLLMLAADYGIPRQEGVSLTLRMSQAEFSDLVGWSRPKVNQELKRMEAESLIQISYSHILILDMARLRTDVAGEGGGPY